MRRVRHFYEAGKPWWLFFLCLSPTLALAGILTLIFGTERGCL